MQYKLTKSLCTFIIKKFWTIDRMNFKVAVWYNAWSLYNSSAPFNIQLTSSRSAAPRDKSYMPHKSDTLYVKPLEKSCSFASTFQSAIWYLQNINIGRDFYYHLLLPPTFFHFWLEIWDSEWWNSLPIIFVHVTLMLLP